MADIHYGGYSRFELELEVRVIVHEYTVFPLPPSLLRSLDWRFSMLGDCAEISILPRPHALHYTHTMIYIARRSTDYFGDVFAVCPVPVESALLESSRYAKAAG